MTAQLPLLPPAPPTVGGVEQVALDRLPPDDAMDGEPYAALVESLRRWGGLHPILVRAVGGGLRYDDPKTMVNGRRRIKAMRRLRREAKADLDKLALLSAGGDQNLMEIPGYPEAYARYRGLQHVPVRVISDPEGTLQDGRTEVLLVATNAVAQDNPQADFRALTFLVARLTAGGATEAEAVKRVASATGLSVQTVKQRLRLADLSPELQDDFLAGRLGYAVALHASRLGPGAQARLSGLLDAGEAATLALVKQAKRDAVAEHQASLLDLLPVPGPEPGDDPGDPDLLTRAGLLHRELVQIKIPVVQEAAHMIAALLKRIEGEGE